MLREPWSRLALTPLRLTAGLFVVFAALRAESYFGGESFRGLPLMAGFLAMWFVPPLFLTAEGARRAGLVRPRGVMWIPVALFFGTGCAYACYLIGFFAYGYGEGNWFVTVGQTYQSDPRLATLSQSAAFAVFTLPAVLFSPVGEELFFRGFAHEAAREKWGYARASLIVAGLFAAIHLVHHGIYRSEQGWGFLWVSGSIWFALMFGTSLVFTWLRRSFGSIWVSALAHAAFNLTMNYTIFYALFVRAPAS